MTDVRGDEPVCMTFPSDPDAVARIVTEDYMASLIANVHARKNDIDDDTIPDELAGRSVCVTTAELGLVGADSVPDPTAVTLTGTFTRDQP